MRGRDGGGEGRDAIRDKQRSLREDFKESAKKLKEGASSAVAVGSVAREIAARFTSEGRSAVQRSLEQGRKAALDATDAAGRDQARVLETRAEPLVAEQTELAKDTQNDAQSLERAASGAPLKSTQREIAEAAKAAREDADFRTKVAGEQRDENARAKALAEEQARIAQGTSAKLR
jgi:hypothetical protein